MKATSKSSVCKMSPNPFAATECCENLDRNNVAATITSSVRRSNLPTSSPSFRLTSTYHIATYILLAVILYSSALCMAQYSGKYALALYFLNFAFMKSTNEINFQSELNEALGPRCVRAITQT